MFPSNEERVASVINTQSTLDPTIPLSSEEVNDLLDANQDLKAPDLIATIKKWARGTKLAAKNVNALDRLCDRLVGTLSDLPTLQHVTEKLETIEAKLDRRQTPTVTYAAVASRPTPPDPPPRKPARTDEIAIKITRNSSADARTQGMGEELREWVESSLRSSGVAGLKATEVVGVQPHRRGSKVTVRFKSATDVQQVVKSAKTCSSALGEGAKVSIPHFGVVISEVPLFYDPTHTNTRRDLQAQNPHLIPDVSNIVDLRWLVPKDRLPKGRHTGSWVLIVDNRQAADNLIDQSVKVQALLLGARRYFSGPKQCRKCQKWGHLRAQCHAKATVCSRCSGTHDSSECSHQGPPRCVNCSGSHEAFSILCGARQEEQARSLAIQAGAGTYFAGEEFVFQPFPPQ